MVTDLSSHLRTRALLSTTQPGRLRLASETCTAKGTYLLLPGFSELEVTNERGMELLEISVNNLMVVGKRNTKAVII